MSRRAPRLLAVLLAGVGPATATAAQPLSSPDPSCDLRVHPGERVGLRVAHAPAGARICFTRGTYRLRAPLRPRAGQTLVGTRAVLDGARVLHGFRQISAGWTVGGQRQQGERNGVCRHGTACTYPDDVLVDGAPVRRVLSRAAVRPHTYFLDYRHDTLTLGSDPHGRRVEAMVVPTAVLSRSGSAGADVTVRGLTVEHFASRAQHGAIETSAPGWLVTGTTVRVNHGAGITTQGHVRVVGNRVLRNGQLGIGGTGPSTYDATRCTTTAARASGPTSTPSTRRTRTTSCGTTAGPGSSTRSAPTR